MSTYRLIHADDVIKAKTFPVPGFALFVRNAEPEQSWITDFTNEYDCVFPVACINDNNEVVLMDTRKFS